MADLDRPATAEDFHEQAAAHFAAARHLEALAACERALALRPDFIDALIVRARVLEAMERFGEAVDACNAVLDVDPDNAGAYYLRGLSLKNLKRFEEALADYEVALDLSPDLILLPGDMLLLSQQMCEWEDWQDRVARLLAKVEAGENATQPFVLPALPTTPQQQLAAATVYARATAPPPANPPETVRAFNDKLRIGYYSSDLHDHPVGELMVGILEAHDRSQVEVVGFALGGNPESVTRRRIAKACDKWFDVARVPDDKVVALSRRERVHIAVDLNGYTSGERGAIFWWGAAPVQVNYLGFPGTLGPGRHHYIIGDRIVSPPEDYDAFSERVVTLPDTYLPGNTIKLQAPLRSFTRRELGVPEDAFVFCCFNAAFKITPDVFDVWMRLLHAIEGSVLWLYEDNAAAVRNLKKEARTRGIAPDRLIFAKRTAGLDYLARYHAADLFLDTFHYNAHATAHDALLMGIPMLTRRGTTFAGRVGASLLSAVGVPELIAADTADYERMALHFARHPAELKEVRRRLVANRDGAAFFDSARLAGNLERAYLEMWRRHEAGLAPDHFAVAGDPAPSA